MMKTGSTMPVFLRLLGMGRRYLAWYACLSLMTVLLSMVSVAVAEMFRQLANAATQKDMALFIHATVLAAGILVVQCLGSMWHQYLSGMLHIRSTLRMQVEVLQKIETSQMVELDPYHSADLIQRVRESASQAQSGMNVNAQQVFGHILQIVFILSYLSFMNVWLTLGGIIIAAVLPLIINLCAKPMSALYERRQAAIAEQEAFIQDVIQGAEVVRSYSLTDRMKSMLAEKYQHYFKHHFKLQWYEVMLFRSHTLVWMVGVLYAFGLGGYFISAGKLEVGDVVAFAIVFERFAFPLSALSGIWTQFQQAIAHGRRLFELLDLQEEPKFEHQLAVTQIQDLHFRNICFSYHSGPQVLNGVTMTLHKGKSTALVGPSGSGKSTLAYLLLLLYEPKGGDLFNGNQRIHDLDYSDWRQRIAYMPQEPILFTGTFFENIAIGREGATLDEVMAAAKSAQIHHKIDKTKMKYDTRIGEGEWQLSGGEKQRIALARVFLQDPELVILDEPTSALDANNEMCIVREVEQRFRGKTLLLISHRPSTIQMADHIVVLEHGKVAESGTHHDLLQLKAKYYEMVHADSKGESRCIID